MEETDKDVAKYFRLIFDCFNNFGVARIWVQVAYVPKPQYSAGHITAIKSNIDGHEIGIIEGKIPVQNVVPAEV